MFFMPIRSGMTRWSICPSVSSVFELFAARPCSSCASALGQLDALAQLEGVIVGDDDLGAVHVVEHVARDELAAGVVAVRIVRLQDAQPVLDRQAGRDDEKAAGEVLAARAAHGVDRLPGDQHRHDGGLARAGRQLQREPHQFGIGVLVGRGEMFENALAVLAGAARPRSARSRFRPLRPGRRTGGRR